jgi:hypothetical protein
MLAQVRKKGVLLGRKVASAHDELGAAEGKKAGIYAPMCGTCA